MPVIDISTIKGTRIAEPYGRMFAVWTPAVISEEVLGRAIEAAIKEIKDDL